MWDPLGPSNSILLGLTSLFLSATLAQNEIPPYLLWIPEHTLTHPMDSHVFIVGTLESWWAWGITWGWGICHSVADTKAVAQRADSEGPKHLLLWQALGGNDIARVWGLQTAVCLEFLVGVKGETLSLVPQLSQVFTIHFHPQMRQYYLFLIFLKKILFVIVYKCTCIVGWYAHIGCNTSGGQKRAPDSLQMDLQVIDSSPRWVLGSELGSSAKAVNTLNSYHALNISPAPCFLSYMNPQLRLWTFK